MRIRTHILVIILIAIFTLPGYAINPGDTTKTPRTTKFKFEAGIELMIPYHKSRQIQTISQNFLCGFQFFKKWHLQVLGGFTTTYAYGNIIQWDQNFQDVTYQNAAFGAGPIFQIRIEPLVIKKISISIDIGTGIIFYTNRFPYGGDYYNFMSRIGGSFIYHATDKFALGVSGKWMHVSNGQGLGAFNPSYEAIGMSVEFSKYF